jgi:hypothetical protein
LNAYSSSNSQSPVTYADDVANTILTVANDKNAPLYSAAGEDAIHFLKEAQLRPPFTD